MDYHFDSGSSVRMGGACTTSKPGIHIRLFVHNNENYVQDSKKYRVMILKDS